MKVNNTLFCLVVSFVVYAGVALHVNAEELETLGFCEVKVTGKKNAEFKLA